MSQFFGSKQLVKTFHELLEFEARQFLFSVYKRPEDLAHHARGWVSSAIDLFSVLSVDDYGC